MSRRAASAARRGAAALLAALLLADCRPAGSPDDPVDVVYAGSLTATLERRLAPVFAESGGRAVRGEPYGSVAGANQIRDGVRRPDLYITADPGALPLLGPYDPGWAIAFAAGELAIAWSPRSRYAASLDSAAAGLAAWHEVLARRGFRLGRTDPALDPKGYRTLWLFEAAEEHYRASGLAARLLGAAPEEETVFPEPHLPARVEAGAVDAGVFYLAEARAHGLRVLRLPPEVNQGSPALSDRYARRSYTTREGLTLRGAPIVYAATIPSNAPDPAAAEAFLAFLLGPAGRGELEAAGFPPLARPLGDAGRIPAALRSAIEGG